MRRMTAVVLLSGCLLLVSPLAMAQKSTSQQKPPQKTTPGNPTVKVWVNTASKTYHCPGTRYYGKTKSGEYMTQKEAQEKGDRPARGKVCR
jgi:hypothetical protein